MTNLFKYAFLALSLAAILVGCTRYEEGPSFSLRSATKKIANTWRVKEAVKNNIEITSLYAGGYLSFTQEGRFTELDTRRVIHLPPFTHDTIIPVAADGRWTFLSDPTELELLFTFRFTDPYNINVVYNKEVNEQWKITRLTPEDLWMRNDSMSMKLVPF